MATTNAGKKYEPMVYEGAGRGFMRADQDPASSLEHAKARNEAFTILIQVLKGID